MGAEGRDFGMLGVGSDLKGKNLPGYNQYVAQMSLTRHGVPG